MSSLSALAACIFLAASLTCVEAGAAIKPDNPPRLSSPEPAAQRAWMDAYLDTEDWILAGYNTNHYYYFVSSETAVADKYPDLVDWVRVEQGGPAQFKPPSYSALWLEQVDCAKSRIRQLRYINYSFNNLRGPILADTLTPEADWQSSHPGNINEGIIQAICKSASGAAR